MKILMLILASDGSPEYIQFQSIWRRYTKSNPRIDCFFYKGDPNEEAKLVGDTIYVKIEDSLDTVYEKLMKTLQFLAPRFDDYDYLFRTNLSSFVDFDKYLEFCNTLPRTNCCAAVIGHHDTIPFPSGSGFTLSMDVVKRFATEHPPAVFLDDVSVGSALANWNVPILRTNRVDYRDDGMWYLEHPTFPGEVLFHYRVKTRNRNHDYNVLSELVEKIVYAKQGR